MLDDKAGAKEKDGAAGGMTADQLISLLRTPVDAKSDVAQSGVVDEKVNIDVTHHVEGAETQCTSCNPKVLLRALIDAKSEVAQSGVIDEKVQFVTSQ